MWPTNPRACFTVASERSLIAYSAAAVIRVEQLSAAPAKLGSGCAHPSLDVLDDRPARSSPATVQVGLWTRGLRWRRPTMTQNNPLNYGLSVVPPLFSRRRLTLAAIGCAVGLAMNLLFYLPSQQLAYVLYPWPLLSLRVTKSVTASLALGLSQFPLYGLLIGLVWPRGLRSRAAVVAILIMAHLAGVAVWLASHH